MNQLYNRNVLLIYIILVNQKNTCMNLKRKENTSIGSINFNMYYLHHH